MVREPKRGKKGRGRGKKETLADKPLASHADVLTGSSRNHSSWGGMIA